MVPDRRFKKDEVQKVALDLKRHCVNDSAMTGTTQPLEIRSVAAVHPAAIKRCLAEIGQLDPLIVPPRSGSMVGHFRAACLGNEVVGVGWLYRRQGRAELDVRVLPTHRKQGIGDKLYAYLTRACTVDIYAGCATEQTNAQKFLKKRGFELNGVLFAQRWDGTLGDVPAAFSSATMHECKDRDAMIEILKRAYGESWFTPAVGPADFDRPDVETKVAVQDGEHVGCLILRRTEETIWVSAIGTLPERQNLGIGRAMLTYAMRQGAKTGHGVVLLSAADDEATLRWSRGLGFWTYRSWNQYVRRVPS